MRVKTELNLALCPLYTKNQETQGKSILNLFLFTSIRVRKKDAVIKRTVIQFCICHLAVRF